MFPHLPNICDEVKAVIFYDQTVSCEDLGELSHLGVVAEVYMESVKITDADLGAFAELKNVEGLHLRSVHDLKNSPLQALAKADSLKELKLRTMFPSLTCVKSLRDMESLRVLRLDNTSLDDTAVVEFADRPDFKVIIETWHKRQDND